MALALQIGEAHPRATGRGVIGACFRPGTLLIASLMSSTFVVKLPLARGLTTFVARLPLVRRLTTFCLVTALADEVASNSFALRALAAPRHFPPSIFSSSSSSSGLASSEFPSFDDDPIIANLDRRHTATDQGRTAKMPNTPMRRMPISSTRTKAEMAGERT